MITPESSLAPGARPIELPLRRRDDGGVTILTLDCQRNRNALSEAMIGALSGALESIAADDSVRVLVIAAEGGVFCPGHDLKEMTAHRADPDRGRAYFADLMGRCAQVMQAIVELPQPAVAAVEGVASAAGCQLVASCDLAVAGDKARFCTPGVDIGLFCSTPMVALSRNLSRKHAMEMLLTGDMYDADSAHWFGLVNRVVPAGGALSAALELARQIASKSPLTVATGKRAFYRQIDMPLARAYEDAAATMVENMLAADAEEGIGAFIEKRRPEWPKPR